MDRLSTREPFQVLRAEDNAADTFLVHAALKQQAIEYEMHVVNDGEKGFRFVDRVENGELPCPDVVLPDLNLPCRTGADVLARMRRSDICREVTVVVLTTSDVPQDRQAMQELGDRSLFPKPRGFDDFMKLGTAVQETGSAAASRPDWTRTSWLGKGKVMQPFQQEQGDLPASDLSALHLRAGSADRRGCDRRAVVPRGCRGTGAAAKGRSGCRLTVRSAQARRPAATFRPLARRGARTIKTARNAYTGHAALNLAANPAGD